MTSDKAVRRKTFGHIADYNIGTRLLQGVNWRPIPDEMLKLPSAAKGTRLRDLCDARAATTGQAVEEIIECVQLAARLDHLIAIGGEEVRGDLMTEECLLSGEQIAKLCRRMPPFIAVKLKDLQSGAIKIDTNPTGAFDTNGWAELRTRLPKFRSTLQHYARDATRTLVLAQVDVEAIRAALTAIQRECDALLTAIARFKPAGAGKGRVAKNPVKRNVEWSQATVKLAQVLGVLQKTNRDLGSNHWKPEWVPTVADIEVVRSDVQDMGRAVQRILKSLDCERHADLS